MRLGRSRLYSRMTRRLLSFLTALLLLLCVAIVLAGARSYFRMDHLQWAGDKAAGARLELMGWDWELEWGLIDVGRDARALTFGSAEEPLRMGTVEHATLRPQDCTRDPDANPPAAPSGTASASSGCTSEVSPACPTRPVRCAGCFGAGNPTHSEALIPGGRSLSRSRTGELAFLPNRPTRGGVAIGRGAGRAERAGASLQFHLGADHTSGGRRQGPRG